MTRFVNRSTFGTDGEGGNVLDLVLTSESERMLDIGYQPPLGTLRVVHAVLKWRFRIGADIYQSDKPIKLNFRSDDFEVIFW